MEREKVGGQGCIGSERICINKVILTGRKVTNLSKLYKERHPETLWPWMERNRREKCKYAISLFPPCVIVDSRFGAQTDFGNA